MHDMSITTVLLYARVSHTNDKNAVSVADQLKELRAWAAREGWKVTKVIDEQGSASKHAKKARDRWGEVMDAVEKRRADALLIWENSRASRDTRDAAILYDACEVAGLLIGYKGRMHDPSKAEDRFQLGLDALLSEREAGVTRERVLRGVRGNAERGLPHGRHLYGYMREYKGEGDERKVVAVVEDPLRGPVVREMARRFADGESLYAIAHDMNDRGITAAATDQIDEKREAKDKPRLVWSGPKIGHLLQRPGYRGQRVHQGQIIGEAKGPLLIDEELAERIDARFADPRRRMGTGEHEPKYLLTGSAVCGVCGATLKRSWTRSGKVVRKDGTEAPRRKYDTYACTAGRNVRGAGFHVSMRLEHLDEAVSEAVIAYVSRKDFLGQADAGDSETRAKRSALRVRIAERRKYLDHVAEVAAERMDITLLTRQEDELLPLIREDEKELASLYAVDPAVRELAGAKDVRSAWDALSTDERRRIIRAVVTPAVMPSAKGAGGRRGKRGIDKERIILHWR